MDLTKPLLLNFHSLLLTLIGGIISITAGLMLMFEAQEKWYKTEIGIMLGVWALRSREDCRMPGEWRCFKGWWRICGEAGRL
jgi:hypothetical protein